MDDQRGRCDNLAGVSGAGSHPQSLRGYGNILLRPQRKQPLWDDLSQTRDWADFASIMAVASQIL
ncbi:hypothetical protein AS156_34355 [Bradyrhizobium macuxiense]|uniref:Uncharacterized protein n=1 Tax=Bradyrhizobium macuxiense TaxID=1755647 RepID=A0A109K0X1_9BRAD|nr:hypothetical protein [Bradyrhizobium macuxiense]KWV58653.1 hypothetical protein AS156_34355 [Bradyrhizobium macuxiense]